MKKYQKRDIKIKEEMFRRNKDGETLQQIADDYGISKQAVASLIKNYHRKIDGYRGSTFHIDDIPFQGIYNYFLAHKEESISSFCRKVYGKSESGPFVAKMRNFLRGEHDVRFSIPTISKICQVVGMSFEEAFQRREK